MRVRRHVRRPPDLTSLFDVLFIVVFAALIRAAAVQHAAEQPPPPPPRPSAPATPPAVAALRQRALAELGARLAERTPLVVRITKEGMIRALDVGEKQLTLDAPLLEHHPDPDIVLAYIGDRSAELRVCRIAALHLGVTELSRYLVIISPMVPLGDLPHALFTGLHRDLERCVTEQRGLAVLIDPSSLPLVIPSPALVPPSSTPTPRVTP